MSSKHLIVAILLAPSLLPLCAQSLYHEDFLPPTRPWSGRSELLVSSPGDPWVTPAESVDFASTPNYEETVAWTRRLVNASPRLNMVEIGSSLEGRAIWMVIASASGERTADELRRSGRPTVLVHAGIHAGEIDGKDAGLMLLRDMTVNDRKVDLLEAVNVLFIPILNVDGHERISATNRINQRGPSRMGRRTNARNLNLNRDFTKLETEEVEALVEVINSWRPDLYVDLHVTDGADYQYDVTYGFNERAWSPTISEWLTTYLRPAVDGALIEMGHVPGPLVFAYNERDMEDGNQSWTASPRFSTGYADLRHLPAVIVENHSLKPYRRRVLGTYVFLEEVFRVLGDHFLLLRTAAAADSQRRPDEVALNWVISKDAAPDTIDFRGIVSETVLSPITGGMIARWTGEKVDGKIPNHRMSRAAPMVRRPSTYYIPAAWSNITEKLKSHGIQVHILDATQVVPVDMYRLPDAVASDPAVFEGRMRTTSGTPATERRNLVLPAGSATVSTDQPLGELAVVLLEPQAEDSFFSWGYFLEILQRNEYAEAYVMEPMARQMLAGSPELRQEFEERLETNKVFAGDADARLQWFYERTAYFDSNWRLYPIGRSTTE